ncbi:hypothetical protein GCM10027053_44640 [Intrasporangium mesophilum]
MSTTEKPRHRTDLAHHHPRVSRVASGRRTGWTWECSCGGTSGRASVTPLTWHQAFVGALIHSASIAP